MKWVGVIAFVLLSVATGPCQACSPPRNWRPKTFMERLGDVPIAFRGKVTSRHNFISGTTREMYDVTFDVECVYKGVGHVAKSVTVPDFGFAYGLCTSNQVADDTDYFIFAGGDGDLWLYDANVQSAATEATSELIAEVESVYSCVVP